MAGPAQPSGTNVFIPSHAATGGLLVGFSRNVDDFPINNYIEIFSVTQMVGYYAQYTSRNAARILTSDDSEHLWADGGAAPSGVGNLDSFEFFTYRTARRCYPFTIGELAVNQAEWNILLVSSRDMAQQAMTARTLLTYSAVSSASWGVNTAPVDGNYAGGILPAGNNWTTGSNGIAPNQGPNIKLTFQYCTKIINQQTIGVVKPRQLTAVYNPTTAQAMAASTEIQDYIKQSPEALAQLRGDKPSQNGVWGLPDTLYGLRQVVDDCVRVSTPKGAATTTLSYVWPDGVAALLCVPGVLEGLAGSRSYSTIQLFFYQDELTVETMYDQPNRRYTGRVVTNYQSVLVSTYTGFYLTNCLG